MEAFDHERLEVYRLALEFVVLVEEIVKAMPSGQADRIDQLRRASTSIVLNTAEGAGEFSKKEKGRFYRMAKRSATECAGVLDILRALQLGEDKLLLAGRAMLLRIVSMLIRLILSVTSSGTGTGRVSGTGTGTGTGTGKPKG
jgi:four helix bundle protein